ncbi:MAG: glycosyltransferase [Phycisphaeraceae bacterium]|nr:glycosyltransferase [Phycisphaeraceae bacterium]
MSVVVPLLNEEESIEELHGRLTRVLTDMGRTYEILFVNDGSTDASPRIIDQLAESDRHIGVIHFRRNFGKAAALDAAFSHARGEVVITMDADLQDEPNEIPSFLEKLDEGYDLVSGWKQIRNDPVDKTLPSKLFNWTVSQVSGLKLDDFNCGFKAYRREAVCDLRLYGEMHRFVPVLVHWNGFRVAQIPVEHHARQFGKSKYGVERLFKGFFDLLTVLLNTRYRTRPLHLFGCWGAIVGLLGFAVMAYLSVLHFTGLKVLHPRPLLFLGMLLILVGIQVVSTGLLGELINRSSHDTGPPSYRIRSFHQPGDVDASSPRA